MFLNKIWTQCVFTWSKHIENKKLTVFSKTRDFPAFSNFPENFDFGPFLSQNSRSGNIFDAFKLHDIASANLYLSFTTKIKALPVLVLKI